MEIQEIAEYPSTCNPGGVSTGGSNEHSGCGRQPRASPDLRGREDHAVSASRARRYDRWRDIDGTHVPVGAWVEQTETDARRGALRSRLHARGQVTSQGTTRLLVRFEGEEQTVSIRPHLVRVIPVGRAALAGGPPG